MIFLQLQIWDTAGQERFRTITQSYYRSADAIVIVFDIGVQQTFRDLPEWLSEVERYAGNAVHRIIIGNKSDRVDREVSKELGTSFASENGMPYLETSAKNSNNIDELFMQLAQTLRDTHTERRLKAPYGTSGPSSLQTVKLTGGGSKQETKQNGGCCS